MINKSFAYPSCLLDCDCTCFDWAQSRVTSTLENTLCYTNSRLGEIINYKRKGRVGYVLFNQCIYGCLISSGFSPHVLVKYIIDKVLYNRATDILSQPSPSQAKPKSKPKAGLNLVMQLFLLRLRWYSPLNFL